jgi:hypothetical protein
MRRINYTSLPTRRLCSKSRGTSKRTASRHRRSSSVAAMATVFVSPRLTTIVVTGRSPSLRKRRNRERQTHEAIERVMPDQERQDAAPSGSSAS